MTRKELKDFVETNDTSFFYNGNEYYIFLLNDGFNVGSYENDKSELFNEYDNMLKEWKIEDKALETILDKIELNY